MALLSFVALCAVMRSCYGCLHIAACRGRSGWWQLQGRCELVCVSIGRRVCL